MKNGNKPPLFETLWSSNPMKEAYRPLKRKQGSPTMRSIYMYRIGFMTNRAPSDPPTANVMRYGRTTGWPLH